MNNQTIKSKLTMLILLSAVALLAVGLIGYSGINTLSKVIHEIGGSDLPTVYNLEVTNEAQTAIQVANLRVAIYENDYKAQALFAQYLKDKQEAWDRADKGLQAYRQIPATGEEEVRWEAFSKDWEAWKKEDAKVTSIIERLSKSSSEDEQKQLFKDFYRQFLANDALFSAGEKSLNKIVKYSVKDADESAASAKATAQSLTTAQIAVVLFAVILAYALGHYISQSIISPLHAMQRTISDIDRDNDFTKRVAVTSNDEVGQTVKAFNALSQKVQTVLKQVSSSADEISGSAVTLASSSEQMATASMHQSEAASSMAAAVEEMTVSVNHISDGASEVLKTSRQAGNASQEGHSVIASTVNEMTSIAASVNSASAEISELGQQSDKISDIIKVIREVAEQTNLLALNAAIEAARAGEQGRGFAVVADEVRKLAERTANSTKEITEMVSGIQAKAKVAVASMAVTEAKVAQGQAMAEKAGSLIGNIADGSRLVVVVVDDMASAMREQSAASNDIANNVEKVAQMTEENSAAARQTSISASRLEQLATELKHSLDKFKV